MFSGPSSPARAGTPLSAGSPIPPLPPRPSSRPKLPPGKPNIADLVWLHQSTFSIAVKHWNHKCFCPCLFWGYKAMFVFSKSEDPNVKPEIIKQPHWSYCMCALYTHVNAGSSKLLHQTTLITGVQTGLLSMSGSGCFVSPQARPFSPPIHSWSPPPFAPLARAESTSSISSVTSLSTASTPTLGRELNLSVSGGPQQSCPKSVIADYDKWGWWY